MQPTGYRGPFGSGSGWVAQNDKRPPNFRGRLPQLGSGPSSYLSALSVSSIMSASFFAPALAAATSF